MSFKYRYFACVIFAVFGIASAEDDHKINVTIFYQSLDPASAKFFADNFQANTSELLKFIDVRLIPFGNTRVMKAPDGTVTINCEHGEAECYGNKVHTCAMKFMPKPEDQINFIVCTMKSTNPKTALDVYPLRECVETVNSPNLNRTLFETCAKAKEDYQFLDTFEKATNNALGHGPGRNLPAIIFGKDQYDVNSSRTYEKNFHDALCQRLTNATAISAICPNVTPVIPTTTAPPVVTTPEGKGSSATITSVMYLPLVLAVIIPFNLKLH